MSGKAFPRFISFGEALTDLIRTHGDDWSAKTGGAGWNVARATAAQEVPSAFAGAISQCCFGDALWAASAVAGLDLRFLQRHDKSPLLAIVPQAHPPRYFFIGSDSADLAFAPQALPAGWEQEVVWAHFGGISLAREPLAACLLGVAEMLHRRGVTISFDPNHRNAMGPDYAATFERLCRIADVIKVSDEDLVGIYGTADPQAAFARVRELNLQAWWLYTAGAEGAILSTPSGNWQARPPRIEVVDTVGAGDACMAGLVTSRLAEPEAAAERHLGWAVASGSAACLAAGAVPPDRASVARLFVAVDVTPVTDQ